MTNTPDDLTTRRPTLVSADLHLLVDAAKEDQHTVLVAEHLVTGAVHDAGAGKAVRHEPAFGQLRVVDVALGRAPAAEQQLALHARGCEMPG